MKSFKLILSLFLLFRIGEICAQLPASDPTWTLQAVDNFTGTVLNSGLWKTSESWMPNGFNVIFDPINVSVSSGSLHIKCEDLRPGGTYSNSNTWYFRSGFVISTFAYSSGYWEMSAKLPYGNGFYPSFWTIGGSSSGPYNEIDIVENFYHEFDNGDKMGMHYHWGPTGNNYEVSPITNPALVSGFAGSGNIGTENKYAAHWEKDRITWYFNDIEVGRLDRDSNITLTQCNTVIGLDLLNEDSNYTGSFPSYVEVNYFKQSQLIPDCNTVENICSFNAGTYLYKVKKSINIAGSSCTSSINTSSNVGLWATDFILLDQGTTITDNGSGSFVAKTTPCPTTP